MIYSKQTIQKLRVTLIVKTNLSVRQNKLKKTVYHSRYHKMQYNGSGSFGTLDPDKNGKMDPVTLQSEKMEV